MGTAVGGLSCVRCRYLKGGDGSGQFADFGCVVVVVVVVVVVL